MRPISHPDIHQIAVETILHAFSDPVRALIFMKIKAAECPQICSAFLNIKGTDLPKSTLSQHFRVLREAGLIRSERKGVEMRNVTRCAELKERFGGLIEQIARAYAAQYHLALPECTPSVT